MNAGTHARWMIVGAFLFVLGMYAQSELTKRRAEMAAKDVQPAKPAPMAYRISCDIKEVVEACRIQKRMEKVVKQ